MAKKKKQTRAKTKPTPELDSQSGFWPLAGGILLILLALFLLLGGFGTGGPLPVALFRGNFWLLGWAAYMTPVVLAYLGILKFTSEDRQIPLAKFVSIIAALLFSAAWFQIAFMTKDSTTGQYGGGHGGQVGALFGSVLLSIIDKWPAALLCLVLAVLAYFFAFGISPKIILKIPDLFGRKDNAGSELGELKSHTGQGLKLNEGVPVEHSDNKSKPSSIKTSISQAVLAEGRDALTTASDPDWQFPSLSLLNQKQDKANAGDIDANARVIQETFAHFNINVEMEGANIGPRVTQYTLKPPTGVKLTKITALENNLALDLAATSIRMEAPIPGKRLVGIEVPNIKQAIVRISSLFLSEPWQKSKSPLSFVVGKDISGTPVVKDLDKLPHLLVAGQTGSGKSVMINTILTSLLYHNSPSDLKLILVDPKQVELTPYNDIPHLLTPVINDPEKCISALKWAVAEMDRRLRTMAEANRRNIAEYNALKKEEGMPYIVIVIDELADLMMMAARDVESLIVRLAQKARAAGIHLVLATQRPSVDVITGLIKANVPGRIAFTTQSQVDSRTIIDQGGAEKLLGGGDMLLLTSEMPKPKRIQGAFLSDEESLKITDFLRAQRLPQYDDSVISQPVNLSGGRGGVVGSEMHAADEPIYREAIGVVVDANKASTSLLQRRLRIGYGKAARLIETMEEQGIVGPQVGSKPREVLISNPEEAFGGQPSTDFDELSTGDDTDTEQ